MAPAGFLISRIETGFGRHLDRLDPAEGGAHLAQRGGDPLRRDPEPQPGGDGGERVVDVVEAGQRRSQPDLAGGGADRRARAVHAAQLDRGRRDVGRGRSAPQLGQE